MNENFLKEMVFMEPLISAETKQRLFQEINYLDKQEGPNLTPPEIFASGLGGIAGFMAAKNSGAGPLVTATVATLGALVGRELLRPRENKTGFGNSGVYVPY